MKKRIILLLFLIPLVAYSATYTIKENGKVYSNGVQTTTNTTTYYNNFTPNNYNTRNQIQKSDIGAVEIVMDYSGSMADWIVNAKKTMRTIVSQIPPDMLLGFRAFGQNTAQPAMGQVQGIVKTTDKNGKTVYKALTGKHLNQAGGCSATEQVTKIEKANASNIINGMNTIDIGGSTPMVLGLEHAAYSDFSTISGNTKKKIILITDGYENCGKDPCAFAKNLMKQRSDISIDVILVSSNSKKLKCLATNTGGSLYNVNNPYDFSMTLIKSIQTEPNTVHVDIPKENGQSYEFVEY